MSDVVVVFPLVPVIPTQRGRDPSARNPTSTSAYTARPASRGAGQRRHVGRHARRHHDRGRARDALEVVPAELHLGAEPGQLPGPALVRGPGPGVRCVHRQALVRGAASSRPSRSCRAPPRRLPARVAPAREQLDRHAQRTFSVERATSAQSSAQDVEARHHRRLGPAELLEVVVQRRHPEDPVRVGVLLAARALEPLVHRGLEDHATPPRPRTRRRSAAAGTRP